MYALLFALLLLPGPDAQYRKAEILEEAGDDAAAATIYEEFLAAYPAHTLVPGARMALAWIHLRRDQPSLARERLTPLEDLEEADRAPYALFYLLTRAEISRAERNLAAAEGDYRAVLSSGDPALVQAARLGLGLVLGRRGAHREAEGLLSEYIENGGGEVLVAIEARARARAGMGLVPRAIEDWERVARMEAGRTGGDETAVRESALLLAQAGDPDAARSLTEYLRRYPRGAGAVPAHLNLLERARDKGDTDDAILHAKEILRTAPLSFSALEAHLLLYQASHDPAERAFHEAMVRRISPEALEAHAEEEAQEEVDAPPAIPALAPTPAPVVSRPSPLPEPVVIPPLLPGGGILLFAAEDPASAALELLVRKALAAGGRVALAPLPSAEVLAVLRDGGIVDSASAGAEIVVRIRAIPSDAYLRAEVEAEVLPAGTPRRTAVLLPLPAKEADLAAALAQAISEMVMVEE